MKEISFRDEILPLKDKFYRLALRITLNAAEAEDIVQDTLMRMWSKRAELAEVENLETYGLTICRNLSLDRKGRRAAANLPLDAVEEQAAAGSSGYEPIEGRERLQWVRRLFNSLPERQRSVMQLRDIEGKSYREIAAVMGWSEDQVKVTLFRARRAIRTQYEKIEKYGL